MCAPPAGAVMLEVVSQKEDIKKLLADLPLLFSEQQPPQACTDSAVEVGMGRMGFDRACNSFGTLPHTLAAAFTANGQILRMARFP